MAALQVPSPGVQQTDGPAGPRPASHVEKRLHHRSPSPGVQQTDGPAGPPTSQSCRGKAALQVPSSQVQRRKASPILENHKTRMMASLPQSNYRKIYFKSMTMEHIFGGWPALKDLC
ncbi:unnamed protein product [Natator depressus]